MKPEIRHMGSHTLYDFFAPSLRWDSPMERVRQRVWVDGHGNLLTACWHKPHELKVYLDALHVDDTWPPRKQYLGDHHWQECRLILYSTDIGEGVIILTDPRIVALADGDMQMAMDHIDTDDPDQVEAALLQYLMQ